MQKVACLLAAPQARCNLAVEVLGAAGRGTVSGERATGWGGILRSSVETLDGSFAWPFFYVCFVQNRQSRQLS